MAKIKERVHELHPTVVKRRRKDGDYCEVIVRFYDPNQGKYRTVSHRTNILWSDTAITKDYAKDKYASELIEEVNGILEGDTPQINIDVTFAEYLDIWINFREHIRYKNLGTLSANTIQNDKMFIRQVKPYFQKNPVLLRKISDKYLYTYLEFLKDNGKDNNYRRRIIEKISEVLNRAVKERYITDNPVHYMDKPAKSAIKQSKILSVEQMRLLLERVKGDPCEPFVYTICFSGVRFEEALGLAWDKIDFENDRIYIHRACKNILPKPERFSERLKSQRSRRSIKLARTYKEYLLSNLKPRQEQNKEFFGLSYHNPVPDVILRADDGAILSPRSWYKRYTKFMAKQPDIPYVPPKDLRKTFNSLQREADISDIVASWNMGHTPTINTEYYTVVSQKKADEAIDVVGDMITPKTTRLD